ncbi:MAG: hypothetical protein IKC32_04860 [Clostridia bacterium]|nr:hypothetical protein [Clostridia bacterium]
MCIIKWFKEQKRKRRERIYESPSEDGGVRIRNDCDMPKEILSDVLISFSCKFSTVSLIDEAEGLERGFFSFSAKRTESGVCYSCSLRGRDNVEKSEELFTFTMLEELNRLIKEHNVASFNGRSYKVSGLPEFFGAKVEAEYDSGEQIYCYNNQDMFLPIGFICGVCRLFGVGLCDPDRA